MCKAEMLAGVKAHPRFVTANIPAQGIPDAEGKRLVSGAVDEPCEKVYGARGLLENEASQCAVRGDPRISLHPNPSAAQKRKPRVSGRAFSSARREHSAR